MNVLARDVYSDELAAPDERLLAEIARWIPLLRRLGVHGPLMGLSRAAPAPTARHFALNSLWTS